MARAKRLAVTLGMLHSTILVLQRAGLVHVASTSGADQLRGLHVYLLHHGYLLCRLAQTMTDTASTNATLFAALRDQKHQQFQQLEAAGVALDAAFAVPSSRVPVDVSKHHVLIPAHIHCTACAGCDGSSHHVSYVRAALC
ncbi:hypothetical protein COO60DRAFT_877171 [Scenedesmus sp. NREL 46B-D3]|nr:hypothetical protein COO60DRAFT_877171 [Scenedesmus sp. NREL 46B-D3]